MSYRRAGNEIHERGWARWLRENADLVALSGLPLLLTSSEEHWNYFIEHNEMKFFGDDSMDFSVKDLTPRQRASLLRLLRTRPSMENSPVETVLISMLIEDVEKMAVE